MQERIPDLVTGILTNGKHLVCTNYTMVLTVNKSRYQNYNQRKTLQRLIDYSILYKQYKKKRRTYSQFGFINIIIITDKILHSRSKPESST